MQKSAFSMDTGEVASAGTSLTGIAGDIASARVTLGTTGAEDYANVHNAITSFHTAWDGDLAKVQASVAALGTTTTSIGHGVADDDHARSGLFGGSKAVGPSRRMGGPLYED